MRMMRAKKLASFSSLRSFLAFSTLNGISSLFAVLDAAPALDDHLGVEASVKLLVLFLGELATGVETRAVRLHHALQSAAGLVAANRHQLDVSGVAEREFLGLIDQIALECFVKIHYCFLVG
jgi:hypothetical protein